MEENIAHLTTRVRELEQEHAERKPVSELIKLLIYFLFAISIVLGLFGLKQFSDLKGVVSEQVQLQLPRDKQRYYEYEALVNKTKEVNDKFEGLFGKYQEALSNYKNIDKLSEDFDIEGKVARLLDESNIRSQKKPINGNYEGTLLDEKWRAKAISILTVLSESQKKRDYESDFIFNAAQLAGRLQLEKLQLILMKVAHEKRPNDEPIKAGYLSSIVDTGLEEEVGQAFGSLMEMVRNLSPNSPHIVLAEAWNAAEDGRLYRELIVAITDLLESESAPLKPSYAYALLANAQLRASGPGDIDKAKINLEKAKRTFASESSHSVWAESTLQQIKIVTRKLVETELLHSALAASEPNK